MSAGRTTRRGRGGGVRSRLGVLGGLVTAALLALLALHGVAGQAAAAAGTAAAVPVHPAASTGTHGPVATDDGGSLAPTCTTCAHEHVGVAMACLVALLLVLAVLTRPRSPLIRRSSPLPRLAVERPTVRTWRLAPSLHALGISRT